MNMTTKEIQKLIGIRQVIKFHNPVCENVKYLFNDEEIDVLSVSSSGMLYEFEVKISRSDFLSDKKKKKHNYYFYHPNNSPNYFSYVCPKDLIQLNEINESFGLYYVNNRELIEIRKPKIRHRNIYDIKRIMEKVCRVYAERTFLGMCRLTLKNKEIREKNKEYEKFVE